MKDKNGAIYLLLGVLVAAVLVLGYFVLNDQDDPAPVVVTETTNNGGDGSDNSDNGNNGNQDNAGNDDSGSSFDLEVSEDGVSVSTETSN